MGCVTWKQQESKMAPSRLLMAGTLVVVLSLVSSVAGQACRCAETEQAGMGYLYCNCAKTWAAANTYCADFYQGQLAIVRTARLQQSLQQHLIDNVALDTWIGARGKVVDWHWIHDKRNIAYQGCFQDDPINRDLSFDVQMSTGLTPTKCIVECKKNGFRYAGLQAGSMCFCGNSFGVYGFATECSNQCSGDFNLNCGGPLSNQIYQVDGIWSGGWVYGFPSSGSGGFDDRECMIYKCEQYFGWTWQNAKCERPFRVLCMFDVDNSTCIARGMTPTAETCISYQEEATFSWFNAVLKCQELGGRLLEMTTALSHWAIRDALKDQCHLDSLWLGSTKVQWTWTSGEPLKYSNWAASRPSSKGDKCVAMSYILSTIFEWSDLSCDKTEYFLCERPSGPVQPTTTTTTTTTTRRPSTTSTRATTTSTPPPTTTRPTTTTSTTSTTTTSPIRTSSRKPTPAVESPRTSSRSPGEAETQVPVKVDPGSTATPADRTYPPGTGQASSTLTPGAASTKDGMDWVPIYIGIAVASAVVLLILACVIYTCRKRCKPRNEKKATMRVENGFSNRAGFVHDGDFAYKNSGVKNGGFLPERNTEHPRYVAVTPNNHAPPAPPISVVPPVLMNSKDADFPDNVTSTVTSAASSEPREDAASQSSSVSSSSSIYIGELEDQGVGVKYVHPRDEDSQDTPSETVRDDVTPEIVDQPTLPMARSFHSRGQAPLPQSQPSKGKAPAPPSENSLSASVVDISTRL